MRGRAIQTNRSGDPSVSAYCYRHPTARPMHELAAHLKVWTGDTACMLAALGTTLLAVKDLYFRLRRKARQIFGKKRPILDDDSNLAVGDRT